MAQSVQVHVVLDLETDGEPIRGSISVADEPMQAFFGWIELAARLEQLRNRVLTPPLSPIR